MYVLKCCPLKAVDRYHILLCMQVSDFGLSRIHIGERTIATQTYGTVTHMPPELLSEGRLSKAADVCELLFHLQTNADFSVHVLCAFTLIWDHCRRNCLGIYLMGKSFVSQAIKLLTSVLRKIILGACCCWHCKNSDALEEPREGF